MTQGKRYRRFGLLAAALGLILTGQPGLDAAAQAQQGRLVVLELFTSQGCNSCPPADALMSEWAKLPGVLPISLHVDYWDYLGWKDTLSRKGHNVRQHDYARNSGSRQIYTPQIVVDGQFQAIGSNRDAVETALYKARKQKHVPLQAERGKGGGWLVRVPGMDSWEGEAKVLLCRYDRKREVTIERGENHGRTLEYLNVAQAWNDFGRWKGQAASFEVPDLTGIDWSRQGALVMLQTVNGSAVGPIIGAIDLKAPQ